MSDLITAYCDGSSTGKSNKPWGWGFVVVHNDIVIGYGYGGGPSGTNNMGELSGAIQAMEYCIEAKIKKILLISDSMYCLDLLNGDKIASKNRELVEWMLYLKSQIDVKTRWVKGHSGDKFNEIADRLAKKGKQKHV